MTNWSIGPLISGGFILGYRCGSKCRHCLYGSGPHRNDGLPDDEIQLNRILDQFADQSPQAHYHIGGGEPFLHFGLLQKAVAGFEKRRLHLDYVETNASWVKDEDFAGELLSKLAAAGLRRVLVSLSPFHAEHVPLEKTLTLIRLADELLPLGAFVWIRDFLADLNHLPENKPIDFDALVKEKGNHYALSLGARYSLVPAGRAGRYFHHHGCQIPTKELIKQNPCAARLADTSHFHIDGQGNYIPGLCAGIVLPFNEVPGSFDEDLYPLTGLLIERGVGGLVDLAGSMGFIPTDSYSSPCDLCTHVRFFLHENCPGEYPELGPPGFYDDRSFEPFGF